MIRYKSYLKFWLKIWIEWKQNSTQASILINRTHCQLTPRLLSLNNQNIEKYLSKGYFKPLLQKYVIKTLKFVNKRQPMTLLRGIYIMLTVLQKNTLKTQKHRAHWHHFVSEKQTGDTRKKAKKKGELCMDRNRWKRKENWKEGKQERNSTEGSEICRSLICGIHRFGFPFFKLSFENE